MKGALLLAKWSKNLRFGSISFKQIKKDRTMTNLTEKQLKQRQIAAIKSGAYIFGQDYGYQQQLFQDFFKELQSYKPDYSDSHNSSLYWKLENSKPIFDNFSNILEKYRKRNASELKQREVDKLRKQLQKVEQQLTKGE
jgi:hypothetical protein